MNLILNLLAAITASLAAKADPVTYTHPLESTLSQLATIRRDLSAEEKTEDEDVKSEVARLKARAADLAEDAMLVPVRVGARKLSRLGFDVEQTSSPNGIFELKRNANHAHLLEDAYALRPERWEQVRRQATQARRDVLGINGLLYGRYRELMPPEQTDRVAKNVFQTRTDVLRRIKDRAEQTINCITHYAQAYADHGLRPVGAKTAYTWSPTDLRSKYGVDSFNDLNRTQKTAALPSLRDMIRQASAFDYACVPVEAVYFMIEQKKELGE